MYKYREDEENILKNETKVAMIAAEWWAEKVRTAPIHGYGTNVIQRELCALGIIRASDQDIKGFETMLQLSISTIVKKAADNQGKIEIEIAVPCNGGVLQKAARTNSIPKTFFPTDAKMIICVIPGKRPTIRQRTVPGALMTTIKLRRSKRTSSPQR
jgi:hypothetical protein